MQAKDHPIDLEAKLLCKLLSFNPPTSLDWAASEVNWAIFTELVCQQWLPGLVYPAHSRELMDLRIPAQALETLRVGYLHQVSAAERRRFWLARVLNDFDFHKISVVILKGAYLAEVVYADPVMRVMEDNDLLVPSGDLQVALAALSASGYAPQQKIQFEMELKTGHELPLMMKIGAAPIELHWRLFDPGSPYEIDMNGIWQRAAPFIIFGAPVLGLCPEDLLLYLCAHSAHHRLRHRLRSVYDVAVTLEHFRVDLDWDQLLKRAHEWHAERAAFLLFWLAGDLLQAPIPAQVLERLQPADFGEEQAEIARRLVLSLPDTAAFVPPHLSELSQTEGFIPRLRLVTSQLFLPIDVMRRVYAVPSGSWMVLICYPKRWFYLLRKGFHPLWRMLRGEKTTLRQAEADYSRQQEQEKLAAWLELDEDR